MHHDLGDATLDTIQRQGFEVLELHQLYRALDLGCSL